MELADVGTGAGEPCEHEDRALLDFLDLVDLDLHAGSLRPLERYLARFPRHADLIEREYLRLCAPDRDLDEAPSSAPIGERYRVVRSLGRGGFGEVFLADDLQIGRRVAIKVLNGIRALNPEWRTRLVREAQVTDRIDHPAICPVFDVGFEGSVPFLVMPWIDGRSLERVYADSAARGIAPVQLGSESHVSARRDALLALIEQLAWALHAAHAAGVVHRDVKPANVLLRRDGSPVLIDFGLAWLETADPSLTGSAGLGTPAYAAPELLAAARSDPAAALDVWSLGVMLFEGLTARRPFVARAGESLERCLLESAPPRLDSALGRDLQAVVECALARRPERRYATMADFAEDLARVRRGQPVSVQPAGVLRRLGWWVKSRPRQAATGVVLVATVLTLAILGTVWWTRSIERSVVARAMSALVANFDDAARDAEQLARYGHPVLERAENAERVLRSARELRDRIGSADDIDLSLAGLSKSVGALHIQLGRTELGASQVADALAIYRALERRRSVAVDFRKHVAHAHILLGDADCHRGLLDSALVRYREAQSIEAALLAERPDDATRVSDAGFGRLRIGHVLARLGRIDAALPEQREAVRLLRMAETIDEASLARRGHTCDAMLELDSTMRKAKGLIAERQQVIAELDARSLDQTQMFPLSAVAWHLRAIALRSRYDITSDPAEQLVLNEQSVAAATRAAQLEPNDPHKTATLVGELRQRALALAEVGRFDEARASAVEATEMADRIQAAHRAIRSLAHIHLACLVTQIDVARNAADESEVERARAAALAFAEQQHAAAEPGVERAVQLAGLLVHDSLGSFRDPRRALAVIESVEDVGHSEDPQLAELAEKARALLR